MEGNCGVGNRIQGLAELISAQDSDRLPPVDTWNPPSRGDIGMAIEADGTWLYQGSPIARKRMVTLFSRILRRDSDGRHYLVTPVERVEICVADAPFLAVELQVEGTGRDQQLIFRTNVDDIVHCGPEHPLLFSEEAGSKGLKPYLRVRGRLDALVTRALYYDLVALAVADDDDSEKLCLWSGGVKFDLVPGRDDRPID